MLSELPQMDLYNEQDLITNIHGLYQENKQQMRPLTRYSQKQPPASYPATQGEKDAKKSYSELAREKAKEDIKKKRSAPYLTTHFSPKKNRTLTKEQAPTAYLQQDQRDLIKYSQHLRQNQYILAQKDSKLSEKKIENKPKQDPYDYLRKSQLYDQRERQIKKEQAVAQELQLPFQQDQKKE